MTIHTNNEVGIVYNDGEDTTIRRTYVQSIGLHNQRPDEWIMTISGGDLGDEFQTINLNDVLTLVLTQFDPWDKGLIFSAFSQTWRTAGVSVWECADKNCGHITISEKEALCHRDMPHDADEDIWLLKGGLTGSDTDKAMKIAKQTSAGIITADEARSKIVELLNDVISRVVDANDVQRVHASEIV